MASDPKVYIPPRPWHADEHDITDDEYRVVRSADGRPLAYIDRALSQNVQNDIAKLIVHAPDMLEAQRMVFFAHSEEDRPQWTSQQWKRWRQFIGPKLADMWLGWV